MHFCSQCGQSIPHREKFCQNCGTKVEYLSSIQPLPTDPAKRREIHSAASITKWIVFYLVAIVCTFGLSFLYFSSPGLFSFSGSASKQSVATQSTAPLPPMPQRSETPSAALKSAYNQFSVLIQKSSVLIEESRKVNVPGDSKATSANYRSIQRGADALLVQLTQPPDASTEISAVLVPLKESLSLLSKSVSIMADYLDGKLSLAPPNPDWVGRSQEYSAQSQVRLKEAQQALVNLRKKLE